MSPRGSTDNLDKKYPDAFNFAERFADSKYTTKLYVVVFRSTIVENAVSTELFQTLHTQDHKSYVKASTQIGGLLKYWFGEIDKDRRNLATCVWIDREHAVRANKLEQHRRAVELVREVYESWVMERYALHMSGGKIQFEML